MISLYTDNDSANKILTKGAADIRFDIKIKGNDQDETITTYPFYSSSGPFELRTHANAKDSLLCYATGIVYGGWCWFISPDENDNQKATELAKARRNADVSIKYINRIW